MNVKIIAVITAVEGKENELRPLLKDLVNDSRNDQGCIQYDLTVNVESPNVFIMIEVWEDAEALEKHATSEHFKAFQKLAENLLTGLDVHKIQDVRFD